MLLLGYSKIIPYTKFEQFEFIIFLSYAAHKQIDKRTDKNKRTAPNVLPTPTNIVRG